jgi:D-alanine-D-alanine ligase-like ATP-grasp enzyme
VRIAFVFNRKTDETLEQAEFDSPETVDAITRALASGGHEITPVEMPVNDSRTVLAERLSRVRPDFVFNTAEGYSGVARESFGPSVFEELGIPFTGTGSRGCLLTLDKAETKRAAASAGARVVPGRLVLRRDELAGAGDEIGYPVFVKPNFEGSSKGISRRSVCRDEAELLAYGTECLERFPDGLLVERFIVGRDIGVPYIAGLGDGGVLEPVEYALMNVGSEEERIYDYDRKNVDENSLTCVCPARVAPAERAEMVAAMARLVPALGIRDVARADFRRAARCSSSR